MGKLALSLKASLNGVTNLSPVDEENYYYSFKVECTHCREKHPNWVGISRSEVHDIPKSKGEANFILKCRNCRRDLSISFEEPFHVYKDEHSGERQNLLILECRGCEIIEFQPDGEWQAEGTESGTKFPEVDLSDEWYDYDEKTQSEVSITDIEWSINRQ